MFAVNLCIVHHRGGWQVGFCHIEWGSNNMQESACSCAQTSSFGDVEIGSALW
jgi:hypothetical protein